VYMSTRRGDVENEDDVGGLSLKNLISKALSRRTKWVDKDDLLDVIYWGRQFLSLIMGVAWGFFPLRGLFALILYVALSTFAGHYYLTCYQEQDQDSFGGFWEIAKEGFGAAFATFMVSWITTYSAIHFD